MDFDFINPKATVTIALLGPAICCFNKEHNDNRGRWEVAVPRYGDHALRLEIPNFGAIVVDSGVKLVEVKPREAVADRPKPWHQEGDFDRTDKDKSDKNDFRWVTNFTDNVALTQENDPIINSERVGVTMFYFYDATLYTKDVELETLIQVDQDLTAPIVDGKLTVLENEVLVPVLDKIEDFFFEAKTLGIDIESAQGSPVEIFFDNGAKIPIPLPEGTDPVEMLIEHRDRQINPIRVVPTENFEYGLGDFYRYFELFKVDGTKSHHWGKRPIAEGDPGPSRTCCCNMVQAGFNNLNAFL